MPTTKKNAAKAAKETANINSVSGVPSIPGENCAGNGQYMMGDVMPTLAKQAIRVTLNVKFDETNTGAFERYPVAAIDPATVESMRKIPAQWRLGYNVKFVDAKLVTYLSAGDAKDQGFLTESPAGSNMFVWNTAEAAYEASATAGVNGKIRK